MPVKVFCACGSDVTEEVPPLDRKTRTLEWFDTQSLLCAACRRIRGLVIERNEAGRKTIDIAPRRS
jgi:hypothetical protein